MMDSRTIAGPKPSLLMEQHKHNFTKSENKIYEYILSNPNQVLYHSLTELSELSGVAEATVLRFFRKLGFKGFQDFKFLVHCACLSKTRVFERDRLTASCEFSHGLHEAAISIIWYISVYTAGMSL